MVITDLRENTTVEVIVCPHCGTVQSAEVWWQDHAVYKSLRVTDCKRCFKRIYHDDWFPVEQVLTVEASLQMVNHNGVFCAFYNGAAGISKNRVWAIWKAIRNKWKGKNGY